MKEMNQNVRQSLGFDNCTVVTAPCENNYSNSIPKTQKMHFCCGFAHGSDCRGELGESVPTVWGRGNIVLFCFV